MMKKTAFKRPEHEKIAKGILRDRFDADLFLQVHNYIDLEETGRNHRRKHGHNTAAEEEIGRRWRSEGIEHFKIHLLADWVYDHLAQVVGEYYDKHKAGNFPLPYYEGSEVPYCEAQKLREGPEPPGIALARAAVVDSFCRNCGAEDNLTFSRFWAGMMCRKCLDERQIEVCLQCSCAFYSGLRKESTTSEGKYLCPLCAETE